MITGNDKLRLREIAKQQAEIANSAKMQDIMKRWYKHNAFEGDSPMVVIELWTFINDIVPDLLRCESEEARKIETMLLKNIVNHTMFGDDQPVFDYIPVQHDFTITPFDIKEQKSHAGDSVGHHFESIIKDLQEDFHKLKPSTFIIPDKSDALKQIEYNNEIFGDILPSKLIGRSLYSVPTQNIIHIMSMEDFFMALYDYPELVQEMLNNLADDYIRFFRELEKGDYLLPTTIGQSVAQGTFTFTKELPSEKNGGFVSTDIWGSLDSQETVGVSADMFKELIFPCYEKIAKEYGLLSYGCCEPVHTVWDSCVSKLDNLRKVSISPWCDENFMGEALKGRKTIYHRKPSPNFIGVGETLDEEAVRAHIVATLKAAKGCKIEFTQRDVYTVNKDVSKVKRYVDIIKEEIQNHYQG